MRQQTIPQIVVPPRFIPRTRRLSSQPEWLTRLLRQLTERAVFAAGLAALVILLATALPAWALQRESSAGPSPLTNSSAGATGTAATRVEELGVATFIGGLPLLQQSLGPSTLATTSLRPSPFLEGARQATLVAYLAEIGNQMTVPALNDAVATKRALDAWEVAIARRLAAGRAAPSILIRPATPLVMGTRLPNALVTFYACIGNGFCGGMASGQPVFAGAAACSYDLPLGTRFTITNDPTGRTYVCLDRGVPTPTWVDIWFYDAADGWAWQASVGGTRSDIIIVE